MRPSIFVVVATDAVRVFSDHVDIRNDFESSSKL